jgi:hypothetical protein
MCHKLRNLLGGSCHVTHQNDGRRLLPLTAAGKIWLKRREKLLNALGRDAGARLLGGALTPLTKSALRLS